MNASLYLTTGVALAALFTSAGRLARQEHSLILVLAGVFALLPDGLEWVARRLEGGSHIRGAWSHALPLAALFGLAGGLLFGETAGWVIGLAFGGHGLLDLLGTEAVNPGWPFTRRGWRVLKWLRPERPAREWALVWSSGGLAVYGLNRAASPPPLAGEVFLLWAVLVPVGILLVAEMASPD